MSPGEHLRRTAAAKARMEEALEAIAEAEQQLDKAAQALAQVQGAALAYNRVQDHIEFTRTLFQRVDVASRAPDLLLDHDPAEGSR